MKAMLLRRLGSMIDRPRPPSALPRILGHQVVGVVDQVGGGHARVRVGVAMTRQLYPNAPVYVFARSDRERQFARELGAAWTGDTGERAPVALAAIIDTTPAWYPIVQALANLAPGGRLVVNAIRKEQRDKSALITIRE